MDHLKDAVVLTARDGTVVDANEAFLTLSDSRRENIVGKNFSALETLAPLSGVVTSAVFHKTKQKQRFSYRNLTFEATVSPIAETGDVAYVLIVLTDISAFVSLEAEFLRKNRELIITNTLSSAFITSDNIDSVFSDLLEKALIISHINMGWIMLKKEKLYELKSSSGLSTELRRQVEEGQMNPVIEKALATGAPLYVLESDDARKIKELRDEGIAFFALIPLRTGPEILGCLVLASRTETVFDFELASLFSLIGNNLSMIADKIKLFQETQRLAITDGLTGLYNARHFYEELDKEIARSERYSTPFSIVLFDIDDFKVINDTYGHQAGDEVLRDVATMMLHVSRKTDLVARYGGEEFITILPNTGKDEAFNHACRIKDAVELKQYLGPQAIRLTVSGGVASYPEDAGDAKSLLYAADMAMYKAKASGKRGIRSYGREG